MVQVVERFLHALWQTVGVTAFAIPLAALWLAREAWKLRRERRRLSTGIVDAKIRDQQCEIEALRRALGEAMRR